MKNKKIVIMVSSVILLTVVLFIGSLISKQDTELDEVKLNDIEKDKLAIMIEQPDGTYAQSNTYPTGNYILSEDRSGCIDKNGKSIPNSVSYKNGTVTFKTNSSSYCYVYFDKLTLVKYLLNEETRPSSLWTSTLDEDGYRFVGTDPNNYLCFGIEDKDTCVGNTDLYMYRIIGIFEDAGGKQYVKLIKKEALNTAYAWHSSRTTDTNWGDSALYTGLNGSYFLSNTTYSYMQNTIWSGKIKDWTWSAVNTLTYENDGPDYYNVLTVSQVYYNDMHHENESDRSSAWTNPSGKIGLMYASDYMLSLGDSTLNYTSYSNSSALKTGWMHLTNNDSATLSTTGSAAPLTTEWTISRYGKYSSYYYEWYISSDAYIHYKYSTQTCSARPAFYLVSNEEYLSGTGSKTDPFMLDGRPKYTVSLASNNTDYGTISSTSLTVYEGDSISITLSPAQNYKYSSNTLGGTVSGNILTIDNVTSDISGTVTFVEKTKYTVNVSSTNTSYGTVSPASQTVYEGDSASIVLAPKNGYVYLEDSCGGTVSGNIMTIQNISGNKTCKVTFGRTSLGQYLLNYKLGTDGLNDSLETNSYRYKGSTGSVNNYVCFGTTDKDTCTGDTDKYMYMIIGVQSNGTIELIKKEALNTAYSWTGDSAYFITWAGSPIYNGLNGSYFLGSTSYMKDEEWFNKIKVVNWSYYTSSDWDTSYVTAKVGLMSPFEYDYSYSSSYSTSWLNLLNRDSGAPSAVEMTDTMLRTASSPWYVYTIGRYATGSALIDEDISVRPVFFLKPTVIYSSGSGTLTDPYILSHDGDQAEQSAYDVCVISNAARPDDGSYCQVVNAGETVTMRFNANSLLSVYKSNDCGATMSSGYLTIENVTSDIMCTLTYSTVLG